MRPSVENDHRKLQQFYGILSQSNVVSVPQSEARQVRILVYSVRRRRLSKLRTTSILNYLHPSGTLACSNLAKHIHTAFAKDPSCDLFNKRHQPYSFPQWSPDPHGVALLADRPAGLRCCTKQSTSNYTGHNQRTSKQKLSLLARRSRLAKLGKMDPAEHYC